MAETSHDRRRLPIRGADLVRMAAAAAIALYVVVFVAMNTQQVEIDFVFATARVSLVIALALVAALGFIVGAVLPALLERRRGH